MLLSDLAKDARLDVAAFVKLHPEPILVSWITDDDESPDGFQTQQTGLAIGTFVSKGTGTTRRPASDQTPRDNGTPIPESDLEETEPLTRREGVLAALSSGDYAGAATAVRPAMDLVCLPLVKSNRNPFLQMVTAGRTPNNDLVLRDTTVSKFHAYFTLRGPAWWLHDQSSTNGSFVARAKIGTGGAALSNGVRVAFGQRLAFRFFLPAGIHELLNQL